MHEVYEREATLKESAAQGNRSERVKESGLGRSLQHGESRPQAGVTDA